MFFVVHNTINLAKSNPTSVCTFHVPLKIKVQSFPVELNSVKSYCHPAT